MKRMGVMFLCAIVLANGLIYAADTQKVEIVKKPMLIATAEATTMVSYPKIINIVAVDSDSSMFPKLQTLKEELKNQLKTSKETFDVETQKNKIMNEEVGYIDEYLSNWTFYNDNKMIQYKNNKKEDGLIKLIRKAQESLSDKTTAVLKTPRYNDYLNEKTIEAFIANLYDIVTENKKISKSKSIKEYGMYRVKGWFHGWNRKYYLPHAKVPFFAQPESQGWTARTTLLTSGAVAAAVGGLGYLYYRDPIKQKAKVAYEYARPYGADYLAEQGSGAYQYLSKKGSEAYNYAKKQGADAYQYIGEKFGGKKQAHKEEKMAKSMKKKRPEKPHFASQEERRAYYADKYKKDTPVDKQEAAQRRQNERHSSALERQAALDAQRKTVELPGIKKWPRRSQQEIFEEAAGFNR